MSFKIVTWNVNSIRARIARLNAFVERHDPDIICLQELKSTEDQFPLDEITALGYQSYASYQQRYNGVAILSKSPMTDIEFGIPDFDDNQQARVISASFDKRRIVNIYAPNGQNPDSDKFIYKLNWYKALCSHLAKDTALLGNTILLGDFNIAPTADDVHNPKATAGGLLCTDQERQAYQDLIDLGLSDAYNDIQSEESRYTWWDYRSLGFQLDKGFRIDLILLGQILRSDLETLRVDRKERRSNKALSEKPSDHAPLIATFK